MRNIVYAALDIGTSRTKLAVFDGTFQVIAEDLSPLNIQGDSSTIAWSEMWSCVDRQLRVLGDWCQQRHCKQLRIGLCGQISSIVHWDRSQKKAVDDHVPMWMDRSCLQSIEELRPLLAEGRDLEMLGSSLPLACNWLLVKLHHYMKTHTLERDHGIAQLHDAVFHTLSGKFWTHPSAQVSICNQRTHSYDEQLLKIISCDHSHVPEIHAQASPAVEESQRKEYAFPDDTCVHVGMGDMFAGFHGFFMQPTDVLWQCNTSEIFAYYGSYGQTPETDCLMSQQLHNQSIHYGSTNAGGADIQWFMQNHGAGLDLDTLTAQAEQIAIGADGLLFLPYRNGERAPLWNAHIRGGFVGLNEGHTPAHKFRAVLEGVAYAKRHILQYFPSDISRCKISGGSTVNALWNRIRCNIINLPCDFIAEKEVALIGCLRSLMDDTQAKELKDSLSIFTLLPIPEEACAYDQVFEKFMQAQDALLATTELAGAEHG